MITKETYEGERERERAGESRKGGGERLVV